MTRESDTRLESWLRPNNLQKTSDLDLKTLENWLWDLLFYPKNSIAVSFLRNPPYSLAG
ncbi:MAG: hypothetical protein WBA22_04145 [Candidatus Methanofastidiosia archaeon]